MKIYNYKGRYNVSGENVKHLREARKLSQEQLATLMQLKDVQMSQKAISRLESGVRIITDYELMILAKVLNVDVESLLPKD